MKVVCMLADVPVMMQMEETMKQAAAQFPEAEVVFGDWLGSKNEEEFSGRVLEIEKNGPNGLEIPKLIQENLDAEVLIGAFCPFSRKMMEQMPNLKAICVTRGGMENVDLKAAEELGIAVVNAAGRNANAVSDFTIGMMLSEARNIARSFYNIKTGREDGKFVNSDYIPDMEGKTVGLVGFGHIGRLVAKKLSGFDVQVMTYDPFLTEAALEGTGVKLVDKETLFQEADFVSVHARLTEDTKHLIGREDIARMKPTAYFINTARAGLVDYDALYEALKEKKIAGAALDVFYEEPIPRDSHWLTLENVTLTGHMGGVTVDAQKNSPLIAVRKVLAWITDGNESGIVNKSVLANEKLTAWKEEKKKSL